MQETEKLTDYTIFYYFHKYFAKEQLLLPVAVATGILGLLGGSVIPGAELALDWKNGRQEAMGNGLHYLMKIKGR